VVTLASEFGVSRTRLIQSCTATVDELALFVGVREALPDLAVRVPLGVVTSLPGSLAVPILEGVALLPLFSVVIHAGNCRSRKPSPGPLYAALQHLGISALADVFYVGDHVNDGLAAGRAGLGFAWASYGYGSARPAHTSVVLTRFDELLTLW
jgi:phosphoglycolate phosphatase